MQLMDPTVDAATRDFHRAPMLDSLEGLTIGLLTNGKVNADVLVSETAALFVERHGCKVTTMFAKTNASAPAPDGMLDDIAAQCDFLITASGD
jgi:hypothetical protein